VDHLAAGDHGRDGVEEFITEALTTALCAAPGGAVAVADVVLGTRLTALAAAAGGWLPVSVPGWPDPLWAQAGAVRPDVARGAAAAGAPGAASLLPTAMRLVGTPYVWGGLTPFGIDCSGLVYLAHRLAGVAVPRDAGDQQAAAEQVPLGEEVPGDLYFFAREGKLAHHVGFAAGDGWMVDACSTARRVEHHRLSAQRRETLVGCGRLVPGGLNGATAAGGLPR
jgi:cell wall-associated NlpC family hydrolase